MLYPEAHGTVAGGVLHQHCHIVVLGNNHPVYGLCLILGRIVNGAALNNIECVLRACAYLIADPIFHICPDARIKHAILWHHVSQIKRLILLLLGVSAVSRRTEMSMVIAGTPERVVVYRPSR